MLIGLTGKKRSGKDSVGRILRERGFVISSFAAPLRSFVASILGMTLEELDQHKETPITTLGGITPRYMMQTIGTEWGRQMIHPDMWVESWSMRYAPYVKANIAVVVTDVRFQNEAEVIRKLGGAIVEVQRPGLVVADDHASEAGLSPELIDAHILNDGDLYALRLRVDDMVELLEQRQ